MWALQCLREGGLVVDAGKNTKDPSQKIIPLICRQPFPEEWRFVVAIPNVKKGLANEAEALAFKQLPPMLARRGWQNLPINNDEASSSSRRKGHQKLWRSLNADTMHCRGQFCASSRRADTQVPQRQSALSSCLKTGPMAAGQSSWGPTVYGVVKSGEAKEAQAKTKAFLD